MTGSTERFKKVDLMSVRHDQILAYVLPTFLGTLITVVGWIAINTHEIAKSVAVAIRELESQDSRLERLEWSIQKNGYHNDNRPPSPRAPKK